MLPGENKYPHIFSPVQVGKLWMKITIDNKVEVDIHE